MVSVHFFLAGPAAGTGIQLDAQPLRHAIGPGGKVVSVHFSLRGRPRGRGFSSMPSRSAMRSVQSAAPNGRPLTSDRRTAANSGSSWTAALWPATASAAPPRSAPTPPIQVTREQGVVVSHAMPLVARPAILGRIGYHPGPQRVGLDVTEDHQQVHVVLDNRALEPPLPDVPGRPMSLVVPPGVCDGERLEDAADRLARLGAEEEVEMVGHEAVAEESERVAVPGGGEGLEEGEVVVVIGEDGGAVVAAVKGVVDQSVVDGAGESSHARESNAEAWRAQEK